MNQSDSITRKKYQELVNAAPPSGDEADQEPVYEPEYMWRGHRFRVVTARQAPLIQFRLVVSPQERFQIKYPFITVQWFDLQNADGENEIVMIVRDSTRITISGFNLTELDDALLLQRVVEIQSVSELQAEAALRHKSEACVITQIRVEYGRFDAENHRWLPGNGRWCDKERRWIPSLAESE